MIYDILFLAVALLGCLPTDALARECRVNETESTSSFYQSLTVTTPDQLTALDGCETLRGNIEISHGFSGTFSLPASVVNMTGSIYTTVHSDKPNHGLDAVELPNLQRMNSLWLRDSWALKTLHAPRLETLADLKLTGPVEGCEFDLSALRTVDTAKIAGFYSSISFPSLEYIQYSMYVYTDPSEEQTATLVPVDVDFPILKTAAWLFLGGQIKSLSAPNLERVGDPSGGPRGLQVEANYTAMEGVFLPSLQELYSKLTLTGHVSALDLGGVTNSSADISITAASPIEIYSRLEYAGDIDIHGELAVINLTNLTTTPSLNITSTTQATCPASLIQVARFFTRPDEPSFCNAASIAAAGENPYLDPDYEPDYEITAPATPTPTSSSNLWDAPTPTPWETPSPTPVYSPTPTPGSGGGKLSQAAEAAIISVGTVVGICVVVGWIVVRWRRRHGVGSGSRGGSGSGGVSGGVSGSGSATQTTRSAAAAAAVTRPARAVVTTRSAVDEGEGLPRHSDDVAPPPYSRQEPGKG
ncbi:hypothetical protein BJX64DRAFT_49990 [Aspergillus heterothallicus]